MRRHDLVYLRHGSPFNFLCDAVNPELAAAVSDWIERQRPLVVSRQTRQPPSLTLALTLPARLDRQRLAATFQRQDVIAVHPALTVSACLAALPLACRHPLAMLEECILASGARLGVFGSLAWETLSGEAYRHAASDIDLICDIDSPAQLHSCLAALQQAASQFPCRLDGELRFPSGDAVAWRELAGQLALPEGQVLVKGERNVGLRSVATLLATLHEEAAYA